MDVAERSNCLNRTSAARFRGRLEANSSTASANRFVRCSRSFSIELSTSYFLLSTSYFLLPTFYFLLPTFYFLLSTFYFLLSTSYFLLPTFYFLLLFRHRPSEVSNAAFRIGI